MPVYPNHRAIFVNIPKNGGSTLTTVLKRNRFLGRRVNNTDPRCDDCEFVSQYLDVLGDEAADYFKFSFARNPWDRFVSAYHYVCQRRPELTQVTSHGSFAEFTSAFSADPEAFLHIRYFRPQWTYLTDATGAVPLDFVGRLERFEDDLKVVLKKIGLRRSLVRRRKQTKRSDFRDYYDDESRAVIARVYERDIDLLGYEFEDGNRRQKSGVLGFLK